jgi:regulator of protease activity HflC (stomatin/prohibitin superfamily)
MRRILIGLGTILVLFVLLVSFISSNFTYRVDAGKVGLLIDYAHKQANGSPSVTVEPQSTFFWYNSWGGQAVFEYPIALQTLSMVAASNEGQQNGDDSVTFVTQNGIPLKIDVTTQWRVTDPAKLYFLMPGVPLDGSFNNDVSTKLIRQSVIHALNQSGGTYAWQDVASNENAIEQAMMTQLAPMMTKYGVTVEQIALGQPHYSAQQQAAINNLATAQQQAQQAQFLKQKAQYEADAAKIQAQSQAQQIQIINAQLAKSPQYLQYLLIKMYEDKWDGHLPGTLSTDGKGNVVLTPFGGK